MTVRARKLDFEGTLPKGLVVAKPIENTSYDPEVVIPPLWDAGELIPTRKRQGWKVLLPWDKHGRPGLYTDGINPIQGPKVAHLEEELAELLGSRRNCLLVAEGTIGHGRDNQGNVGSIISSRTPQSLRKLGERGWKLHLSIFNALFLDGRHVKMPYAETYAFIQDLFAGKNFRYIEPVLRLEGSFEEARAAVIREEWEGMVINHISYVMTYRLDGKSPERPWGSWKWKPENDSDFFVKEIIFRPGTNLCREVVLYQLDPDGNEFCCGKFGTFTMNMRRLLPTLQRPFTIQLTHDSRTESGCLENPRKPVLRPEKPVEHCVSAKKFPKASAKRK